MFPSFYFKVEKIIRTQTCHLTPQRRKCIQSVLLTMSHELHCYSKGEKPTANTLLGLGKKVTSIQANGGGVLFLCPGFVLSVYVMPQSEVFLTSFSLTRSVLSSIWSVLCWPLSQPFKDFIWNQIIRFKTKQKVINRIKRILVLSLVCGSYLTTSVVSLNKQEAVCVVTLYVYFPWASLEQ